MRKPDFGDPDGQVRLLPDERAGGAGVIEVDVREQQVADVGQFDPVLAEAGDESRQCRGRAAVLESEPVRGFEQVHADRVFPAAEPQVDEAKRSHRGIF